MPQVPLDHHHPAQRRPVSSGQMQVCCLRWGCPGLRQLGCEREASGSFQKQPVAPTVSPRSCFFSFSPSLVSKTQIPFLESKAWAPSHKWLSSLLSFNWVQGCQVSLSSASSNSEEANCIKLVATFLSNPSKALCESCSLSCPSSIPLVRLCTVLWLHCCNPQYSFIMTEQLSLLKIHFPSSKWRTVSIHTWLQWGRGNYNGERGMLPHTAIWNELIAWNKLKVWIRKQPFSNPSFSWFSRGIKCYFNVQVHSRENGSCLGELEGLGEGCFRTAESAWEQLRMCTGWQAELGSQAGGQWAAMCRDGRNMWSPTGEEGKCREPRAGSLRAHQQTEEFPEAGRQVKCPKKGMSGFQFKIPTALAPSTLLVSPNYQ